MENLLEEYEAAWCSPVELEFMGGARKQDRKQLAFWFECIPYRPIEEKHWEGAKLNAWKHPGNLKILWLPLRLRSNQWRFPCRIKPVIKNQRHDLIPSNNARFDSDT
ncbi:MAG: hypothetical protein R6U56_10215 [Opitutales bacterium]